MVQADDSRGNPAPASTPASGPANATGPVRHAPTCAPRSPGALAAVAACAALLGVPALVQAQSQVKPAQAQAWIDVAT